MKVTRDSCTLAFLPSVKINGKLHSYQDAHPFTSPKYAETWLVADKHGNISYDGTFESKTIADWTKPKYTAQDVVLNAGIKEETVEEAIIAITIAEQALAYAEFVADRGADIVKIVGKGQNAADVAECVRACQMIKDSEKLKDVKVTYHLSGHSSSYVTRVLTPTFYGSYIYFCYPELTEWQDANQLDLDMAAQAYKYKDWEKDISIDDAISLLTKNIKHEQLEKLTNNYKKAPDIVGYIYAVSSMMENKWTFSSGKWTVKLRESTNSNNYTTRSHVYDPSSDGATSVAAAITGNYQPFVSATRKPRVGVFFGNDEGMLALVYNDDTKKIELCYMREGWQFRTSNLHAGGVSEIYMGSPSAKKQNTLTFSGVSYDEIQ